MCLSWFQNDGWGQKKLEKPRLGWEPFTLFRKNIPNFNMGTWEAMLSGHLSMFPYIRLKYIDYVYCHSIISVIFVSAFCETPSTIPFTKHVKYRVCVGCPRMEMQLISWSFLSSRQQQEEGINGCGFQCRQLEGE